MRLCKLFTPILLSLSVLSLASCGGANDETKVITEEEYKTTLEEKAGAYGIYPECTTDYKRVVLGNSKTVRTIFEDGEYKEVVEEYLGKLETYVDCDNQIIHVDTYENDLLEMHQVYYQQDDKFFYYYPASDFTREENTSFSSMAPYYFKEYMEYNSSYSNTFSIVNGKLCLESVYHDEEDYMYRDIVETSRFEFKDNSIIIHYTRSDYYEYTKDYFWDKKGTKYDYKFEGTITYTFESLELTIS